MTDVSVITSLQNRLKRNLIWENSKCLLFYGSWISSFNKRISVLTITLAVLCSLARSKKQAKTKGKSREWDGGADEDLVEENV